MKINFIHQYIKYVVIAFALIGNAAAEELFSTIPGRIFKDHIVVASNKKIPLPDGRWILMGHYSRDVTITSNGSPSKSQPIQHITLMSEDENSPVQYIGFSWTSFAFVNWRGQPCNDREGIKGRPIKETFGTTESSLIVKCVASTFKSDFGRLNTTNNYVSASPITKSLWLPVAENPRVKPQGTADIYGYISKSGNDFVDWTFYINPSLYGIDKNIDINYAIPGDAKQQAANNLLKYATEWNKKYITELEKAFFPSFLKSSSSSIEKFNFSAGVNSTGNTNPSVSLVAQATPPVAQAPRQAEPPRSTLALSLSTSQPNSEGVVTINITTNSDTASLKINGEEAGGRADGRYSVQRFTRIGSNNFEVIATDRYGNTNKQSISVSRQAADNTVRFASLNPIAVRARPATNAVAIIIGIQDYRRVPKAEFASNDARAFYDYAVRGLGVRPENIKLLLDQEADDVEILGAFRNWLPLKARKGQTDVYVFFSGHGLPSDDGSNLYMLPYGVDKQFLDRTAIKQSELIASLQAVAPRSVTMFMDACYSGQIRTGETLLASARPISIQSKASSYPANFNVISASAPDQLASSSPDLKHGVFSYFLMKGMEGEADENKDGNITMAEMQSYLKEYVGKKAMSLNRTQVPQITGDQSRVLVSR